MPGFLYKARDKNGILQTGHLDAVDSNEVLSSLQQRGLIVVAVTSADAAAAAAVKPVLQHRLHGRATNDDKILFCQQLAILLEAGIPLLRSLSVIAVQVESRTLLVAIEEMKRDIEGGWTFRRAMAKHPKIFTRFWVNLVETGEASGHLPKSLSQLSRYLEATRDLQSKALTALMYPMILIGAAVLGLAVFILWIIPIFKGVFESMHVELPLLTRLVIAFSDAVRRYWLFVIPGIVVAVYFLQQFFRTEQGKWTMDRLLLRLPLFSTLLIYIQLAQFARGLGTLLESGVPILASLEIMERSATNMVYGQAIGRAKTFVQGGKTMAEPLEQTGLFPPMMIQMIQVGEEIGELSKMLDRVAKYYEERVAMFLERLSITFEPIAIAVMGILIGTLVISMFLPIFSLAGSLRVVN